MDSKYPLMRIDLFGGLKMTLQAGTAAAPRIYEDDYFGVRGSSFVLTVIASTRHMSIRYPSVVALYEKWHDAHYPNHIINTDQAHAQIRRFVRELRREICEIVDKYVKEESLAFPKCPTKAELHPYLPFVRGREILELSPEHCDTDVAQFWKSLALADTHPDERDGYLRRAKDLYDRGPLLDGYELDWNWIKATREQVTREYNRRQLDSLVGPSSYNAVVRRFAIVRSGEMAYTRGILEGFHREIELGAQRGQLGWTVQYLHPVIGPQQPFELSRGQWQEMLATLLRRARVNHVHYFITIGTQATIMLKEALGESWGQIPFLFLGVTEPVASGILDRLTDRAETLEIAGVAYGCGAEGIVEKVRFLFPDRDRKVVFIYRQGVPQDEAIAAWLHAHHEEIRVTSTMADPTIDDMPDPEAVYFSWYTMEKMVENGTADDLMRARLMIASTRASVENTGLAVAEISVDDEDIGRHGAQMIFRHKKGMPLGAMDIETLPYCFRINVVTAFQRGIKFREAVLKEAAAVFPLDHPLAAKRRNNPAPE